MQSANKCFHNFCPGHLVVSILDVQRYTDEIPTCLQQRSNREHYLGCPSESVPSIQHLAQFFAVTLAPVGYLEAGGRWQDAVGLAEVVLPAVERFRIEVRRRCNLQLQLYKTFLFCWEGGLPPGTPADVELAGEIVQGTFRRGFVCFGCPVREDEFVSHKLMKVADRIVTDMGKAVDLLTGDRQAVWTTLRASIAHQFGYWCQLARPSLVRPVAAFIDQQLWRVLEAAAGLKVPRAGQLLGQAEDFIINVPVQGLEAQPFSEWVVGLCSLVDTCYPAYIGALQQAAPFMAELPALEDIMGGEQCWGEESNCEEPWSPLLTSGLQDSIELRAAWHSLQTEAQEAALYLGEEVEGALSVGVEAAGHEFQGTVRQSIVECREKTRGRLLVKALESYHNRVARPVWSWPERDKLMTLPSQEQSSVRLLLPCCVFPAQHVSQGLGTQSVVPSRFVSLGTML